MAHKGRKAKPALKARQAKRANAASRVNAGLQVIRADLAILAEMVYKGRQETLALMDEMENLAATVETVLMAPELPPSPSRNQIRH